MTTNYDSQSKLLYGEYGYKLNRVLFSVHNELGRYAKEKQYSEAVAKGLSKAGISYERECVIGDSGNIADFIIEGVIILELKAKPFLLQTDYQQVQRYLHICNMKLGILVNFRSAYLQPKRILRRDYL